jgi:hypothetical protein
LNTKMNLGLHSTLLLEETKTTSIYFKTTKIFYEIFVPSSSFDIIYVILLNVYLKKQRNTDCMNSASLRLHWPLVTVCETVNDRLCGLVVSGSGSRKWRLTAVGIRSADHATLSTKVDTNFADIRRAVARSV